MRYLAFTLLLLAGCSLVTPKPTPPVKPTATPGAATPLAAASGAADAATAHADDAARQRDQKTGQLLSKVKSNVVSARAANQGNPDGAPRTKVEGELGVAEGRLASVEADPVELAAAAQRDLLVEQGRAAEARASYQRATDDAKGQAAELAKAKADADQARVDRDTARAAEKQALADYQAQLERNRAANQKALDDLKAAHQRALDDAHQQVLKDQVAWLNRAAAGCGALAILSFGLAAAFGGLIAIRAVAPFSAILGFSCLICFGLAQIVGAWWFKWAILIAVALLLVVAAWWILKKQKEGTLKADAEDKAAQLHGVLSQVIPVLDKAYESAEQSTKDLLDRTVFQPLSSSMNREEKALVHNLRAEPPVAGAPTT